MTEGKFLSEYGEEAGELIAHQHAMAQRTIAELRDHLAVLEAMLDDQITLEEAYEELEAVEEKHTMDDGTLPSRHCPTL